VISPYDDLDGMAKFPKPAIEIGDLGGALTHERKVSGVDEDVAGWNVEFAMKLVRVGNADDSYGSTGFFVSALKQFPPWLAVGSLSRRSQREHLFHVESTLKSALRAPCARRCHA